MIVLDQASLVLGDMSFQFDVTFRRGVITAVCGASGSGKSTLLNVIAGFEPVQSGRVLIDGVDMKGSYPGDRPVSLVFQDHNLFAHLNIFANVGLGINPSMRLDPQEKARVQMALARVGLGDFAARKPSDLSGGERQRVSFARALVRRKPVLLLDEPFAALDPGLRREMGKLLLDLQADTARTTLLVSHDPDEVLRLAEDIVFMEQGRIAFHGSKDDFVQQKQSLAIADFLL
jgi:thiamine transport system ATP-binding protein